MINQLNSENIIRISERISIHKPFCCRVCLFFRTGMILQNIKEKVKHIVIVFLFSIYSLRFVFVKMGSSLN